MSASLARLGNTFADQFTADGDKLLYRKWRTGAPIPVSAAERDSFIATFNRRMRFMFASFVAGNMLWIFLLVLLMPDGGTELDVTLYASIFGSVALLAWGNVWAWGAPSRELLRRAPVGHAFSREEKREQALSQLTYGRLALGALMLLPVLMVARRETYPLASLFWLAAAAGLGLLLVVQTVRKWRFERSRNQR